MHTHTNTFSFVVKPSTIAGVGVFATHNIAKGTHMEVFSPDFEEEVLDEQAVPQELRAYCLNQPDGKLLYPGAHLKTSRASSIPVCFPKLRLQLGKNCSQYLRVFLTIFAVVSLAIFENISESRFSDAL